MSDNKFTLSLLDTSGIQDYIFSSNRLQENIGASEIVYRATTLWMFEILEGKDDYGKPAFKHNLTQDANRYLWDYDESFQIEKQTDNNVVEVIYAAGGNAVLVFRDHYTAEEFTKRLTLKVLQDAPGLILFVSHLPFDWVGDQLSDEVDANGNVTKKGKRAELNDLMDARKKKRLRSAASLGFGVSAICDSTGLPAVGTNEKYKYPDEQVLFASRETLAKLKNRNFANDRLKLLIGDTKGTTFPYDMDLMGRVSGEESYVAVIHADGNRVGDHVKNSMSNLKDNRDYIRASRSFSKSIQQVGISTLKRITKSLTDAITVEIDGEKYVAGKVPLAKKSKVYYLPFRPLVFGGDDVTFLCNGQLGVELATKYLEIFEQEAKNMYACAGVSIVKMHYPFARAYQLSEELTHSAKQLVKSSGPDFSALDWHFAQSGLSGSLDAIREREYMSEDRKNKLYIRPITLKKGISTNTRSWDEVNSVLRAFTKEPWSESHNKVVGLRRPLRKGPTDVEQYRLNFGLGDLPDFAGAEKTGWFSDRCAYFDIIELLDHHVSLTPESNSEPEKEGAK